MPCGLRVLLRRDPLPIAAAWMSWRGGLRREPGPSPASLDGDGRL
ncbi:MAG: hypothetical protein R3B09_31640 [Nannocystaceae bacterium]